MKAAPEVEDISVFPMGTPMIAGPGAIASVMLWVSPRRRSTEIAIVIGAMTAVILLTLVTMLVAAPLMRLIGEKIEAAITRILAVIMSALAAQFVIDGIKDSFPGAARLADHPPHPERRVLRPASTGSSQSGHLALAPADRRSLRRLGPEDRRGRAVRADSAHNRSDICAMIACA